MSAPKFRWGAREPGSQQLHWAETGREAQVGRADPPWRVLVLTGDGLRGKVKVSGTMRLGEPWAGNLG